MPSSITFDLALADCWMNCVGSTGSWRQLVLVLAVENRAGEGERAIAEFPLGAQFEVRALLRVEVGLVGVVGRRAQREVRAARRLLRNGMRQVDAAVLDRLVQQAQLVREQGVFAPACWPAPACPRAASGWLTNVDSTALSKSVS